MGISARREGFAAVAAIAAVALAASSAVGSTASPSLRTPTRATHARTASAQSPIKHVVVIFDENVSFDHYFGTYPRAKNTGGGPAFHPAKGTREVDNLLQGGLLNNNPNKYDPERLSPKRALTCDQDHEYGAEQQANHNNRNDRFVEFTENSSECTDEQYSRRGLVMDYYDGNTVTGLWNYAKKYSMNDNSFGTTFGPSSPGAINLVSGQTGGVTSINPDTGKQTKQPDPYAVVSPNKNGVGTMINDPDPAYDDCSNTNRTTDNNLASMKGQNIGDLLNDRGVTWGWFQGGFTPTKKAKDAGDDYAACGSKHDNIGGVSVNDYSPHHQPFQYYKSTANPHHLPPSSTAMIGKTDRANHQYDLSSFHQARDAGNLPAVSFLKAAQFQDGHAGYSDPIDEQHFLVKEINALQRSSQWKSTAVVVAYDDSDGWYDHAPTKILNGSNDPDNDHAVCKNAVEKVGIAGGIEDRCGPGPRLPLLVISPYAKTNHVSQQRTEQTSILKMIENNWNTGRIGGSAFDKRANTLGSMFNFDKPRGKRVILNRNGTVRSVRHFAQR